ncbi:MAG: cohesin domain-containing protein [Dehalococcoidia bacterium]|jgi:hypothetical protein
MGRVVSRLALTVAIAALCLLAARPLPLPIAEGDGAAVTIDPAGQNVAPGSTFSVDVRVSDVSNLGAFQFDVVFDPAVLQVQSVTEGPFLKGSGRSTFCMSNDLAAGTKRYGCASGGTQAGADGSGILATVTFSPLAQAESSINLDQGELYTPIADPIDATWQGGSVRIGQASSSTVAPTLPPLPKIAGGGQTPASTPVAPPTPPTPAFNAQGTPLAPAAQATAATVPSIASTTPASGVTPNAAGPTHAATPQGGAGAGASASNVAGNSGTSSGIQWSLWGPIMAVGAIVVLGLAFFGFKLIARRRTG